MKKNFLLKGFLFVVPIMTALLLSGSASAQTELSSTTLSEKKGHTTTLKTILLADKANRTNASILKAKDRRDKVEEFEKKSGRKLNPSLQKKDNPASTQQLINTTTDASRSATKGSQPATPLLNFVGAEELEPGNIGVTPPDVVGDVGPNDIISLTNERVRIINKNDVTDVLSFGIDNFFSVGLGVPTITSDPHVRYDRLSGRWFFCAISIDEFFSNQLLLAVSKGSNVSDTSSFIFYEFPYDAVLGSGSPFAQAFLDYPTLGVDAHALLIGGNIFGDTYLSSISYVIDKKALINGMLRVGAFVGGAANILFTPQGVQNDDGDENFSYFACGDNVNFSTLHIIRVRYASNGNIAGGSLFTFTSPTGPAYPVVTKDAPVVLDGLDDRFLAAMIMKNKITNESTLVTAQQFHMDVNGNPSPTGGRMGVRWYELNKLAQVPTLKQKGTLVDPKCEQPFTFWNGTIALNGQGHMLLSASRSSQFTFPEAVISGRLYCDPMGYTQPPLQVSTAKGRYNFDLRNILFGGERWGDYSQVVVDPTDNMTMWAFGEFGSNSHLDETFGDNQFNFDTTFNWAVQVTQIRAPAPPKFKIEFEKNELNNFTISAKSMNNCEGFFDPGPGYQKRLKAQIFGANTVQVKKIKFTDPGSLTLLVNDKQFVPGSYVLVITNPDEQSTFQTFNISRSMASQVNPKQAWNMEETITKEVAVFPNPSSSRISLQTPGLQASSTIEVFDMSGNIILRKFAIEKQTSTQLDVSRFASGTYFVQIKNGKETFTNKFVVTK